MGKSHISILNKVLPLSMNECVEKHMSNDIQELIDNVKICTKNETSFKGFKTYKELKEGRQSHPIFQNESYQLLNKAVQSSDVK